MAERTAAARQRQEELVEILNGAVFGLYMRDKIHARYRSQGRVYASPEAFKQALEQRLRTKTKPGGGLARSRQLLAFDRFLARIGAVLGDAVTLKGGLVLELCLDRARTAKDVDLRMMGTPVEMLPRLQEAGRRDLGDFMTFDVAADPDYPKNQNDGMQYEGLRFRATLNPVVAGGVEATWEAAAWEWRQV